MSWRVDGIDGWRTVPAAPRVEETYVRIDDFGMRDAHAVDKRVGECGRVVNADGGSTDLGDVDNDEARDVGVVADHSSE